MGGNATKFIYKKQGDLPAFYHNLRNFLIKFDNYYKIVYNNYRKWRNHKIWFAWINVKTHLNGQITDVFFIVYLLKYITNIIKANTIIVSTTKPNKSKYIISNKTASIIAPPPVQGKAFLCKWQTTSAYSHFLCLILYII